MMDSRRSTDGGGRTAAILMNLRASGKRAGVEPQAYPARRRAAWSPASATIAGTAAKTQVGRGIGSKARDSEFIERRSTTLAPPLPQPATPV